MGGTRPQPGTGRGAVPLDLATAYAALQNLVLDGPDIDEFLERVCDLAAMIAPGSQVGIVLRQGTRFTRAYGNDGALRHLNARGPCLETIRTASRIDVPDLTTETRWDEYVATALAQGIRSALCLPLVVDDDDSAGALILLAPTARAFSGPVAARADAFADQVGTGLTILLRQARALALDEQLREALATRAVIDQAIGILMFTRRIGAGDAFEVLREISQSTNRKTSMVAADLIRSMTGHPAEPPRPLTRRP